MLGKQIKNNNFLNRKVVFHMNSWMEIPQTVSSRILNSFLTKEKTRFWLAGPVSVKHFMNASLYEYHFLLTLSRLVSTDAPGGS